MKKSLRYNITIAAVLLIVAALLGYAGAALPEGVVKTAVVEPGQNTEAADASAKAGSADDKQPVSFLPDLSAEESARMSNCANYPLFDYDVKSGYLISRGYDGGHNALVKTSAVTQAASIDLHDQSAADGPSHQEDTTFIYEVMADDCWLGNIQYDAASGTAYGLDIIRNGAMVSVKGGEITELPVNALTYCLDKEGVIYYIDLDTMYLRRYVPGAETSQAVLNIRMDCPFIIDGWVVCVSLDEGNEVWAYALDGSGEVCLAEESASCPIIEGNSLFYLSDGSGCICRKDLETGETTVYETLRTRYTFFLTDRFICLYDGDGESGAVLVDRSRMEIDEKGLYFERLDPLFIAGYCKGDLLAGVQLGEDGSIERFRFRSYGRTPKDFLLEFRDVKNNKEVHYGFI